jgi:hypothetical protein
MIVAASEANIIRPVLEPAMRRQALGTTRRS